MTGLVSKAKLSAIVLASDTETAFAFPDESDARTVETYRQGFTRAIAVIVWSLETGLLLSPLDDWRPNDEPLLEVARANFLSTVAALCSVGSVH
jgi:hypothetical protein